MLGGGLTFTKEDFERAQELDKFISSMEFTGKPADVSKFYRCLVWYVNLTQKIKGNILEVKRLHDAEAESEVMGAAEPAPEAKSKGKAKKSKK